jgi:hypothetical protein
MTREEKIDKLIKGQQLLTYEEWYALNKNTFEVLRNSLSPKETYEEYVREVLGE